MHNAADCFGDHAGGFLLKIEKALIVLACTILLSCGHSQESNVESGTREQVLYIANADEPRELDPQLSTGWPEHNILQALFEALVRKDNKDLSIHPGVAESWTISDDKLTYVFKLRPEARWSNGDPVTAEDFVWSWKRSLLPGLASEWAYMKFCIKNAEDFYNGKIDDFSQVGVKALDPHTLQVQLNYPVPYFLQLLDHNSFYPVHRATIEKFAKIDEPISPWTRPENFVGNGPFVISEWKINDYIQLKKNPQFWDADNIKLQGIRLYPIADQQSEIRAFRSGKIHLTESPQMAIEKIPYYREHEPQVLHTVPTYSTYYYEFNTTKPYFADKRVREAFAYAIDREALVSQVTKAGEVPAYSIVPIDPNGYSPKQQFSFDPEKARALLAEAGYPDGKGFPETQILYNSYELHKKVALAIQEMLKTNLHVKVTLTNQEWKVYLNSKRHLEHDIARAGWVADYVDPSNFFNIELSYSGNNNTGWKNKQYDELIEKSKIATSDEERFALYDKANAILADEMPVIPIFYYVDVNLVSTDVKGWYDNVMDSHNFYGVYLQADD